MTKMRGITLAALVLGAAACQDVPTFPEPAGAAASAQAAALDAATASVQAAIEGRLTAAARDTSVARRRDTTIARPNRPEPPQPRRGRVELAVQLGAEAVDLAERLLAGGADEQQQRLLAEAKEFERKSVEALEEGRDEAAVQMADAAEKTALKAVVLPGGITKEEARLIHDAAADVLAKARSAVQADPTEIKRHLLEVAEQLFRDGSAELGDGAGRRGLEHALAELWKSATISSWLLG